jgi:hypothetical protein
MTTQATSNICYICYESDTSVSPFIEPSPCACKGSNKIHNHCLYPLVISIESTCCICKQHYSFPDGPFTWYHPNGSVALECTFGNNLYQGTLKYYYPDGTLSGLEQRKDGHFHGHSKFYHENGRLKSEQHHINGKRTGTWRFYYPNGNMHGKEHFKNGKLDGMHKYYHENGLLGSETLYVNGVAKYQRTHFQPV